MGLNFFQRDPRDTKFVLFEHLGVDKLLELDAYKDFSVKDFEMIIEEALKVCSGVLGPANQDADRIGAQFKEGKVELPESFYECWKVLVENCWMALKSSPDFGGQGLPNAVSGLVREFLTGANPAMESFASLAVGAGGLIESFGTEEDKKLFVENMYTGVWGGTMCLTEPDSGSDVGWILTTATPDPDSDDPRVYKIKGNKQFITGGQHDFTDILVHLVLARIDGGPPGTPGISLFIVPTTWVNPDGTLGEENDTACTGIEHKMGMHGSPTCSLSFGENDKCRGILLGEPHSGMAKMFQMMNEARMSTGLMGLAQAANAYDSARQYAKERLQGTSFTKGVEVAMGKLKKADLPRVPIIQHEDVRRMLMNLKSGTEAMRAMAGKLYYYLDLAEFEPDEAKRAEAQATVDLLTPLVKSYCTDYGYNLIRDAMQVLGGVGYCGEFPVEQYARDCKVLSIWEGTNYIQALDLIGRKVPAKGGKIFKKWIDGVIGFIAENKDDADFKTDFAILAEATGLLGKEAQTYPSYYTQGEKVRLIPLFATRFLDNFSEVFMGQLILEQALIARAKLKDVAPDSADGYFYRGKIESARFFLRNTVVNVFSRHKTFELEDTSALDIPEESF